MAVSFGNGGNGGSGYRRRSYRPMSEINVTPMVDVMLVLLIIFMVSAPLLTVGVPIDLPETQAKAMDGDTEPLTISVTTKGRASGKARKPKPSIAACPRIDTASPTRIAQLSVSSSVTSPIRL